jgi:signal transduction histidine kinase
VSTWRSRRDRKAAPIAHPGLQTELRIAQSNAALREQILSSMAEGVVLLDDAGAQVYANPAARHLLGPNVLLPAEVLEQGAGEFTVYHPQVRQLSAVASTLEEGNKLVVIQDVTEPRRIDAMRRDFVENVSHELKTPVSGILATAETLEISAREDPPNVTRFVASLLEEAQRLSKLVEDLLDLARLEQEVPALEPINFTDIVRTEVHRIEEAAAKKKLRLNVEIQPAVDVRGNSEDLALAVGNLLVNAVRYTEKGSVDVELRVKNGVAVFEIADTGVGIPGKDLPRIFERFYRVDKALSRETGGTGLGQSIV